MGNVGFWIDSILMNTTIMPTHNTFLKKEIVRQDLCPLIWDKINHVGFIEGKEAARFIHYLVQHDPLPSTDLEKTCKKIQEQFPQNVWPIFCNLMKKEGLNEELEHRGLSFAKDFSYDVVLKLTDLAKGLGVQSTDPENFIQMKVAEKLGMHLSDESINFRHWIVFNAREQEFEIFLGIQVEQLRALITIHPGAPNEAKRLARAHITNAFSMCDAQGTPARNIDFHNFRGAFTPEFYPRRFALKDSIYYQRLDVLAALVNHVLKRYQVCLPPVKYCEFSVSVSDLSRPWVFDVLRSFVVRQTEIIVEETTASPTGLYPATSLFSSFSKCVHDNHFPHLQVACMASDVRENIRPSTPNVTYKFLAGFDRRKVNSPLPENLNDALSLLNDSPHRAIQLMLQEIIESETNKDANSEQKRPAFSDLLKQLETLKKTGEKIPWFYDWVVGVDLFGDELGYPYCPFVAHLFIDYIDKCRLINRFFGVRIHCGENVPFADIDASAYRLFIAHMYIVFRCLSFLQRRLQHGIRIGHGIAFERILGSSMSKLHHRKSSVLLADMRHHARHLFEKIAFEVNITSNEYLLGDTLRQGDFAQTLRLDALFALKAPIILATDDDGIWPIDRCSCVHPGHHSLAAEYCRAITSSLITTVDQLNSILAATKNFCFSRTENQTRNVENVLPTEDSTFPLIIHPDIIRRILNRCVEKSQITGPFYQHYSNTYLENSASFDPDIEWKNEWESMGQVAYVCFCTRNELHHREPIIPTEYYHIFPNDTDGTKFKFIYDNWRRIYYSFIHPDTEKSSFVSIVDDGVSRADGQVSLKRKFSFYSESHQGAESLSPRQSLIHYLRNHRYEPVTIFAFAGNIDTTETTESVDTLKKDVGYEDIFLTIYTNNDKDKFTYYKRDNPLRLQVNPNSARRDENKENFLYALCSHAGAATAALHFIVDKISTIPRTSGNTIVASSEFESSAPTDIPLTTMQSAEDVQSSDHDNK